MKGRDQFTEEVLEALIGKRILVLKGEVNEDQVDRLRLQIAHLNTISDEEVRLIIDSQGGYSQPAFALYDFIRLSGASVIAIVNGQCESAAVAVLQGCGLRLATPGSVFHLHNMLARIEVYYDQDYDGSIKARQEQDRAADRIYVDILKRRTGLAVEEIRRFMDDGQRFGMRFFAERAKELKLIDGIVKQGNLFDPEDLKWE